MPRGLVKNWNGNKKAVFLSSLEKIFRTLENRHHKGTIDSEKNIGQVLHTSKLTCRRALLRFRYAYFHFTCSFPNRPNRVDSIPKKLGRSRTNKLALIHDIK